MLGRDPMRDLPANVCPRVTPSAPRRLARSLVLACALSLAASPATTATRPATLLDAFLPASHFRNADWVRIPAPPSAVYSAIRQVTANEVQGFVPFAVALHAPRFRLTARERVLMDRPMLEAMREEGYVLLGERPGQEIVVGAIGQFWADRYVRLRGPNDFRAFRDPRYARIAMNVWVRGDGKGGSLVSTETRAFCPDPQARQKFEGSWRLWTPGGSLVRTQWLNAVRRRAVAQRHR